MVNFIEDLNVEDRDKIKLVQFFLRGDNISSEDLTIFVNECIDKVMDISHKEEFKHWIKLIEQSPFLTLWGIQNNIIFRLTFNRPANKHVAFEKELFAVFDVGYEVN